MEKCNFFENPKLNLCTVGLEYYKPNPYIVCPSLLISRISSHIPHSSSQIHHFNLHPTSLIPYHFPYTMSLLSHNFALISPPISLLLQASSFRPPPSALLPYPSSLLPPPSTRDVNDNTSLSIIKLQYQIVLIAK